MLAGVNLDGWRDLVVASRAASWEAQLALEASATTAADGTQRVRLLPMRLGPTRVVRPFTVGLRAPESANRELLTPVEAVLTALGASAAATAATALALQGAQPQRISVRAYADRDGGLGYELDLSGDLTAEQILIVVGQVQAYSVVHRTLAEGSPPRVLAASADGRHLAIPPGGDGARDDRTHEVRVEWEAGAFSVATAGQAGVEIDQPKQLFGADRAPSPEDYLLAALAAEALQWLSPGPAEIHVSARRDLRGELGLDDARVALRDILIQCLLPGHGTDDDAEPTRLAAWSAGGSAVDLVRNPRTITVTIRPKPETPHAP
ncbi:hypothetical protein GCM10010168_09410 [Actinoplanes ianthinogenes]|uniref:Baseplate protein J-like domain-containing protein n=1 Tax=Actinoplanes ianthinogenes TaxID=122358 RepID=A0ABM7LXU6_9ACTN|nr:OsmC family protein [Actinoplanes ianthinogenes]BCJ44128.1 hypothetical protein Aiant_47850 [Actinoplanes ianthinogenes]GGQ95962.1 hypothetical protein GCM10010168_09410 [Actinoplanes ianthinogenes]